jgi:hypothetical protein
MFTAVGTKIEKHKSRELSAVQEKYTKVVTHRVCNRQKRTVKD